MGDVELALDRVGVFPGEYIEKTGRFWRGKN